MVNVGWGCATVGAPKHGPNKTTSFKDGDKKESKKKKDYSSAREPYCKNIVLNPEAHYTEQEYKFVCYPGSKPVTDFLSHESWKDSRFKTLP